MKRKQDNTKDRRAKKKLILKKFLNGEDVASQVLVDHAVIIRTFYAVDSATYGGLPETQRSELLSIEDVDKRMVRLKEMLVAANLFKDNGWTAGAVPILGGKENWHYTPDPQFKDVNLRHEQSVQDAREAIAGVNVNKEVAPVEIIGVDFDKTMSKHKKQKQQVADKIKKVNDQMMIDAEIRDRMNLWTFINSEFQR